jgi:hypothetical protein
VKLVNSVSSAIYLENMKMKLASQHLNSDLFSLRDRLEISEDQEDPEENS